MKALLLLMMAVSKSVKDFIVHATSAQAREHLAKAGYTAP